MNKGLALAWLTSLVVAFIIGYNTSLLSKDETAQITHHEYQSVNENTETESDVKIVNDPFLSKNTSR